MEGALSPVAAEDAAQRAVGHRPPPRWPTRPPARTGLLHAHAHSTSEAPDQTRPRRRGSRAAPEPRALLPHAPAPATRLAAPRPRCLVTVGPPTRRWRRRPRAAGSAGRCLPGSPLASPDSTCPKSMLPRPPQQSGPATELLAGSAPGPRSSPLGTASGGTARGLATTCPRTGPIAPGKRRLPGRFPCDPSLSGDPGKCSFSSPRRATFLELASRPLGEPRTTSPRTVRGRDRRLGGGTAAVSVR